MKSRRLISRQDAAALDLSTRVRVERDITDGKASQHRRPLRPRDWDLQAYASSSPWRRWMFDCLGPVGGRVVVDLGCGYHPTAIYLARAGARRVYACDVSHNAVAHIHQLAREQGVGDRVSGLVCAAEELPLPSGHAELIHGEAVLHHLSMTPAAREVARVLGAGGTAVFKDPLGQNPLLEFARDYLKSSAKATDRPLTFEQIEEFGRAFRSCRYRGFGFAATLTGALGRRQKWPKTTNVADRLDGLLLRVPLVERLSQYVVTCVTK
jgi:ubiquinone/menaquinone biosynthesis C-methylase UbiE